LRIGIPPTRLDEDIAAPDGQSEHIEHTESEGSRIDFAILPQNVALPRLTYDFGWRVVIGTFPQPLQRLQQRVRGGVALHLKRFFRTFGAASNKKLRTNLYPSTTWILFRKSRNVDFLNRADH
jgi:hypothetical protein